MSILRHLVAKREALLVDDQQPTQVSLSPIVASGRLEFYTTVSLASDLAAGDDEGGQDGDDLLSVGDSFSIRGEPGAFGKVLCLFKDAAGTRRVEYLALNRLRTPRPYVGVRGLNLLIDGCRNASLQEIFEKVVLVESQETFRKREEFPENVFYIADLVTKDGAIAPPDSIVTRGRWEKRFQTLAAEKASQTDLDRLVAVDESKAKKEEILAPDSVPSYQMKRQSASKRSVPVLTERPTTAKRTSTSDSEAKRQKKSAARDEDDDLFLVDSEEERQRVLIERGLIPEPIASDDGDSGASAVPSPLKKKKVRRIDLTMDLTKLKKKSAPPPKEDKPRIVLKKAKPTTTVVRKETDEKKTSKSKVVGKMPAFAFLQSDDEDESPWVEVSDDSNGGEDDFVVEERGQQVSLPGAFRKSTPLGDMQLYLEYIYFCENDPSFRDRCEKNPDIYLPAVARVEKKVKSAAEVLGSGMHWQAACKKLLMQWSSMATVGARSVGKEHCDVCNKSRDHVYQVRLSGYNYDSQRFMNRGVLNMSKTDSTGKSSATIQVGSSCLEKANLFHNLFHFRFGSLTLVEKQVKRIVDKSPHLNSDENARKLIELVLVPAFVRTRLQKLETFHEAALRKDRGEK